MFIKLLPRACSWKTHGNSIAFCYSVILRLKVLLSGKFVLPAANFLFCCCCFIRSQTF